MVIQKLNESKSKRNEWNQNLNILTLMQFELSEKLARRYRSLLPLNFIRSVSLGLLKATAAQMKRELLKFWELN